MEGLLIRVNFKQKSIGKHWKSQIKYYLCIVFFMVLDY